MGEEFVTIAAGAGVYSGFERVLVRASYKDAARTFEIDVAAEFGPAATQWIFAAGTPVEILFNGALVCAGFVDRYQPKIDEHKRASISISGRSKSQDLIDGAADHKTGHFKKKTPVEIMQELDKAGVGVKTNRQLDKVDSYQITPGETVFRLGEKLLRKQAMTMSGQPDGSILVTNGVQGSHGGALIEGVNIKSGEADHNWSNRHSKVIVRGQRPFGHGDDALQIEASATDPTLTRHRPVIVYQDDDTTKEVAGKRARHRRDKEAGNALTANITVQGFRDEGGQLWTPGYTVFVASPFLAITQDMLVDSVTFSQSRGAGSESVISLVDPKAYGGQGAKGGSAGDAWSSGAGEGE